MRLVFKLQHVCSFYLNLSTKKNYYCTWKKHTKYFDYLTSYYTRTGKPFHIFFANEHLGCKVVAGAKVNHDPQRLVVKTFGSIGDKTGIDVRTFVIFSYFSDHLDPQCGLLKCTAQAL